MQRSTIVKFFNFNTGLHQVIYIFYSDLSLLHLFKQPSGSVMIIDVSLSLMFALGPATEVIALRSSQIIWSWLRELKTIRYPFDGPQAKMDKYL